MDLATAGERQALADARIGLATAVTCAVGYVLFAALPLRGDGWSLPDVLEGPWAVGTAVAMYLSPVVAGLAGYASAAALVTHRGGLPARVRRQHVVTLGLVAVHLALCVATLGAAQLWLD